MSDGADEEWARSGRAYVLKPNVPLATELRALPLLLTVKDVATLLRTSTKAIYNLHERGLLPGVVKIGRRVLFRRDLIAAWLESRTTTHRLL